MYVSLIFGAKHRQRGWLGFLKPRVRLVFCIHLPHPLAELPRSERWICGYEYGALPAAPTIMNCGSEATVSWKARGIEVLTEHFSLVIPSEQVVREEFEVDTTIELRETGTFPTRVIQCIED